MIVDLVQMQTSHQDCLNKLLLAVKMHQSKLIAASDNNLLIVILKTKVDCIYKIINNFIITNFSCNVTECMLAT